MLDVYIISASSWVDEEQNAGVYLNNCGMVMVNVRQRGARKDPGEVLRVSRGSRYQPGTPIQTCSAKIPTGSSDHRRRQFRGRKLNRTRNACVSHKVTCRSKQFNPGYSGASTTQQSLWQVQIRPVYVMASVHNRNVACAANVIAYRGAVWPFLPHFIAQAARQVRWLVINPPGWSSLGRLFEGLSK